MAKVLQNDSEQWSQFWVDMYLMLDEDPCHFCSLIHIITQPKLTTFYLSFDPLLDKTETICLIKDVEGWNELITAEFVDYLSKQGAEDFPECLVTPVLESVNDVQKRVFLALEIRGLAEK